MSETDPAPPRVSVVLPVRNGERFLQEALDSVFAQTFTDFELICVDDASSDDSPAILSAAALREPRIRIVTNANRQGLPASLNIGSALARGALHTWVSDDNVLQPPMLARLVSQLGERPECAIAYAAYREIDGAGTVIVRHRARHPRDLLQCNVVGPAFLYQATVWQSLGGYDESLQGVEDYDFWLRARHRFGMCALDEELLDYRLHPSSMTARHGAEIASLHDRLLEREIPMEPDRTQRARGWLALMLQGMDPSRLRYAARALLAHPPTAAAHLRGTLRWLRAALATSRHSPY